MASFWSWAIIFEKVGIRGVVFFDAGNAFTGIIYDEAGVAGGVENLSWLFTGTLLLATLCHGRPSAPPS